MSMAPKPEGDLRIWAVYPDAARAEQVARELERLGVAGDRIAVAADAGTTEGPVARAREHREGTRLAARLGMGAAIGGVIGLLVGVLIGSMTGNGSTGLALFAVGGALFASGAGAFVGGIASLRSAAPDHRPTGDEAPGGAAVEVRAVGSSDRGLIELLNRYRPTTLELTDATGRPVPPDGAPSPHASRRSGSPRPRGG
jgi:hypothetical protein